MTTLFNDPRVADLLGRGLAGSIAGIFSSMEIAEEEIAEARGGKTEKDDADPLWHAFMLVRPTHDRMQTEFVYRAHCREILARIRDGQDTRPGTDAELSATISEGSLRHPLTGALVTLQMRIFKRSFPEQWEEVGFDDLEAYERMYGGEADDWEQQLRRKTRQDWRKPTREETTA